MDVTKYAKSIFGEEIVISATINTQFLNERKLEFDNNYICAVDACPLIVFLSNGNKIKIWVSEWGGIEKL